MSADDLLDVLWDEDVVRSGREYGVVVGIVTNNDDPDGMGRVRVRFPWLSADVESWWARTASLGAGPGRGIQFLPEVDDEVLVAFEHGDVNRPYVLGALWNGKDAPPEKSPLNGDKQVDQRVIKSRSGHVIRLDDAEGAEKIEIVDKSGKNKVIIDSAANSVSVCADGDIVLQSTNGKIVLKGQGVEITSTGQDVQVTSAAGMQLKATGASTIRGATVNIN